jgi:hypothetical protein
MTSKAPECFTLNEYALNFPSDSIILCKSLSYKSFPPHFSPLVVTIALYFSFNVPVDLCALGF